MTQSTEIDPIVRTVTVTTSKEDAFRLFTEGISTWWPLRSHSVHEENAASAVFECRSDGRIYEVARGGEEVDWGRVVAWEPPNRVLYDWNPTLDGGVPTQVEVTFTTEGDGTRVELQHRGWERLGTDAPAKHANYSSSNGWTQVMDRYVEAAS